MSDEKNQQNNNNATTIVSGDEFNDIKDNAKDSEIDKLEQIAFENESLGMNDDKNLVEEFSVMVEENWNNNAKQYHKLLTDYVYHNELRLRAKREQKLKFFWASMSILFISIVFSLMMMCRVLQGNGAITEKMVEVIPAMTTFLTPLFVIPKIIAEYLFNTKDEEHMIETVKQIIEHDNNSIQK